MELNGISLLYKNYQKAVPSPLAQAALLYGITLPAFYFLKDPVYKGITAYSVGRAKTLQDKLKVQKDMQLYLNSWKGKWGIPAAVASIFPLLSLTMNYRPGWKGYGLTQWGPGNSSKKIKSADKLVKAASMWQALPYAPTSDLRTTVNPGYVTNLLQQNPVLNLSAYALNLGTAILNAVPKTGFNTTLGNIYDSAVNKFDKKLSFLGLASSSLKGVIAGSMAGMFTDVVGAMAGLPKSVMDPISGDIGIITGVGTALKSILM